MMKSSSVFAFQDDLVHASFGVRSSLISKSAGVWTTKLFTSSYCDRLLQEIPHITGKQTKVNLHSLTQISLLNDATIRAFFEKVTVIFAERFVRPVHPHHLVTLNSVAVEVCQPNEQHEYCEAFEEESSLIVNLCLKNDQMKGGELCTPASNALALREALFRLQDAEDYGIEVNNFWSPDEPVYHKSQHVQHHALIYNGKLPHGFRPVQSGSSVHLVMRMSVLPPLSAFPQLPVELQSLIISHMDLVEVLTMSQVSKSMQALCDEEDVWTPLLERQVFPEIEQVDELAGRLSELRAKLDMLKATRLGITVPSETILPILPTGPLSPMIEGESPKERLRRLIKEHNSKVRLMKARTLKQYLSARCLGNVIRCHSYHVPDNDLFPAYPLSFSEDDVQGTIAVLVTDRDLHRRIPPLALIETNGQATQQETRRERRLRRGSVWEQAAERDTGVMKSVMKSSLREKKELMLQLRTRALASKQSEA